MAAPSTQWLSDLLWLLEEREVLVQDRAMSQYWCADWRQRYQRLVDDPSELILCMSTLKSHFLGSYFEQLFSFAVRHFSTLTVLAQHVQIQGDGHTLGEVDMLVQTSTGEVLQLELGIKFYLQRDDLAPHNWVGPNKNDSLHKKVEHARSHQLAILNSAPGVEFLHKVTNSNIFAPILLLYGRLFTDFNNIQNTKYTQFPTSAGWIYLRNFLQYTNQLADFRILEKNYWISGNSEKNDKNQINIAIFSALSAKFAQDSRPVLIQCHTLTNQSEVKNVSLFVCPDDW